jgi:CheY-like chemotaxis protein
MNNQFFLYEYSIEEKNRFLEKVVANIEDLLFVFELNSFKIIFHNNSFKSISNWESIVSSSNFFESIKTRLSPNDLPAIHQLSDKIHRLENRDLVVRDLHIKNKELVYGHYQIEMSLFDRKVGSPDLVICKVHTIQDHLKVPGFDNHVKGFSKIVLVDDDVLTNILNEKIIKCVQPQMEVLVFLSVEEALDWLKLNDVQGDCLIFLDINFPGKNGWDFMKSYSEFERQSKVIVLSSSIVPADKVKALAYSSVLQYMCKPLSFEFIETLLN